MKNFLLSLGVLLCCALASHAQAEYPDVPLDDPAYGDIYLLMQHGVIESGYHGQGYYSMTRYEFAVAIARLLDSQTNLPVNAKNETTEQVTAALKRLAIKFLPELKELDIDAAQLKFNGELLIEPQIAPKESSNNAEYPDVPLSDSAYADINLLSPTSDAINHCYGPVGPRAMTRYEFAVAIARSLERATQQSNPVNFAALKRLGVKFLPELEMLGVDVEKIKINGVFLIEPKTAPTKTQVTPQFLDIPKSHWAFDSVEKLRLSGIVIGVQD